MPAYAQLPLHISRCIRERKMALPRAFLSSQRILTQNNYKNLTWLACKTVEIHLWAKAQRSLSTGEP
jgi:hypothetical protein